MLPGRADFFQPYCVLETDWAIGRKKCESRKRLIHTFFLAEREALEPTYSRNIIKLQIINNQALFGVHSKSKSF